MKKISLHDANMALARFLGYLDASQEQQMAYLGFRDQARFLKSKECFIPELFKDGECVFVDHLNLTNWNAMVQVAAKLQEVENIHFDSMFEKFEDTTRDLEQAIWRGDKVAYHMHLTTLVLWRQAEILNEDETLTIDYD